MENKNLWDNFLLTGKVDDYLKYKSSIADKKEAADFEPYNNKRSDNQGAESWRG